MTDVVDSQTRSRMMSGIASKNTKPELVVRKLLQSMGFRYRLHRKELPGKPDFVLPSYNVAILVNGCFWHGHECHLFKWPKSNRDFWNQKISANRERDFRVQRELQSLRWRVMVVWECATKRKSTVQLESLALRMANWIETDASRIRRKNFS